MAGGADARARRPVPGRRGHPRRSVSPARRTAFAVIRRVFEQGAYADRALHGEARALEPRERRQAMALAYGTVQRRATLDHLAGGLLTRELSTLDPPVLAALRLGLYQLLFLDGIPAHAAINDAVELAKAAGRGGAMMVNAVLRRAVAEGPEMLAGLDDHEPDQAATLHSVPPWLAHRWWQELGREEARGLLRAINTPAESALRVNTLVDSPEAVAARLPVAVRPAPALPEGLVLEGPFDAHGSELFAQGAVMPQARAAMIVSRLLGPGPGHRTLDLCASPGAKTTHLAALMEGRGELVAVERNPARARALESTCRRMRAEHVQVAVQDARASLPAGPFDRVLVDPPCSGLGTLQSRPDLRWRASPESIEELARLQAEILETAGAAVAPGGLLVYSVCTISRREGEGIVGPFLERHREWVAEPARWPGVGRQPGGEGDSPFLQLLAHRDGTDGFFIARMRRR